MRLYMVRYHGITGEILYIGNIYIYIIGISLFFWRIVNQWCYGMVTEP